MILHTLHPSVDELKENLKTDLEKATSVDIEGNLTEITLFPDFKNIRLISSWDREEEFKELVLVARISRSIEYDCYGDIKYFDTGIEDISGFIVYGNADDSEELVNISFANGWTATVSERRSSSTSPLKLDQADVCISTKQIELY